MCLRKVKTLLFSSKVMANDIVAPSQVSSEGMICSIAMLFSMLCLVFTSILVAGWKMTKSTSSFTFSCVIIHTLILFQNYGRWPKVPHHSHFYLLNFTQYWSKMNQSVIIIITNHTFQHSTIIHSKVIFLLLAMRYGRGVNNEPHFWYL